MKKETCATSYRYRESYIPKREECVKQMKTAPVLRYKVKIGLEF